MPDPSVKPPDLDAQGQPVRPPDLDAQGRPVGGGGVMNFAIVNGQRVPVDAAPAQSGDIGLYGVARTPEIAQQQAAGASQGLGIMANAVQSMMPAAGGLIGGALGGIPGALLGGSAGEAYKQLLERVRGQAAPATPLAAAGHIAAQGAGNAAAQAVGPVIDAALERAGQGVMQAAIKPGIGKLRAVIAGKTEVPPVVNTLLNEGVNVTPAGIQKLRSLIDTDNQTIKSLVAGKNADIPAIRVASRLSDVAKNRALQVNAQPDLEAVSQVGQNFLDNPAISSEGKLTLQQAQDLKTGTYRNLAGKYGQPQGAATVDAEKALARGLKEEIEQHIPDAAAVNAHEGRLIDALESVGRRVALSGNRDPIGFAWVTHNPLTFLTALADRSPAVKSLVARGLYSSAENAGRVAPGLVRAAVTALATTGSSTETPAPSAPPRIEGVVGVQPTPQGTGR